MSVSGTAGPSPSALPSSHPSATARRRSSPCSEATGVGGGWAQPNARAPAASSQATSAPVCRWPMRPPRTVGRPAPGGGEAMRPRSYRRCRRSNGRSPPASVKVRLQGGHTMARSIDLPPRALLLGALLLAAAARAQTTPPPGYLPTPPPNPYGPPAQAPQPVYAQPVYAPPSYAQPPPEPSRGQIELGGFVGWTVSTDASTFNGSVVIDG